jgi:glycosyltransferase involved in cell wall biosynthesis
MRRITYAWADRVFSVSQELKTYYCRELGWGSSKFEVIPNGVDVRRFRHNEQLRGRVRARLGVEEKSLVVGSVGRLDPVKDHATLLSAADMALAQGMDLHLVIVGDGTERAGLQAYAARKPNLAQRTHFAGDVRNVEEWLNGFDIFVLPSLSEGMSNTLLEAMAVGIAPIATAVGGNCEVVEDGYSGLLVPPGDIEKSCECLMRLGAQDSWRRWLGENARQRVTTQYSLERMLQRYTDLYCGMLESQGSRAPAMSRA